MTESTDNPELGPVEKLYGKPEVPAEPIKPTAEADVTSVAVQEPPEGTENLDDPDKTGDKPAEPDGSEASGDDENTLYLEIDGKEYTLDEVKKWQSGHMMQSDYTKKTTTLKGERETFEAERDTSRENLLKTQSEVSEMRDQLAVLIEEDEEVDWVELKDSDPDEYIRLKEKADKRKAALDKVKADRSTPNDDPAHIVTEQGKLFAANPDWLDKDNKITDVYTADTALIATYAARAGFSQEEFSQITFSHHQNTLLKAAKYDQLQEKGREIKGEREKVPLVTKPKANASGGEQQSAESIMYAPQKNAVG